MSESYKTALQVLQNKLGDLDSPLNILRKFGLPVPNAEQTATVLETISPAADIEEMITGSEEFSKGDYISGGAKMLGGLAGVFVPGSAKIRSTGKAVGKNIDDQLLRLKYTNQEKSNVLGGTFKPIVGMGKRGPIEGEDLSNLSTSRIEIESPPGAVGRRNARMEVSDDVSIDTPFGTISDDAIEVKANLIDKKGNWDWVGKKPKDYKDNDFLVALQGEKLKKVSPEGITDHVYTPKVIYEKGGKLSTYDRRAARVQGQPLERTDKIYNYLKKKDSNKDYAREMFNKDYKDLATLEKELVKKAKRKESSRLDNTLRGPNPKGRPTTIGVPIFGKKIGSIRKGKKGKVHPVYDQIIMREAGGQVMPMQYGGGLSDAYSTLSDRRRNQNMYGMGDAPMQQMPSQMSSVFQDPMEASAFSPVNMEQGGDIVVPQERMINDQPHELSYINPQEAGLLKALGGSGRRVDGIPAYFSGEEGTDMDDDIGESFSGGDATDSGDMGDGNFATDPGLAQGITGVAPSTPSEEDDYSTYATYGILGDIRGQDKAPGEGDPGSFQQYGLTASQIMDNYNKQGGFSRDMGPLLDLYTPEQLSRAFAVPGAVANIRDAFMNNNFVGGGLPSTLQDAINKGQNIQYGPAFLEAGNRAREEEENPGEEKGIISSAIDTVKDFIMGGKELSPENQAQLNADLSKFGASFTPTNAFAQTITSLAIPMAATLGAKALGTPQTLGFIENRDGLTFEVTKDSKGNIGTEVTSGPGSSGGLDQIDSNDSGNDQVKNKVIPQAPVDKPVVEEDEKSPMSKLLAKRINNSSTIDPNVKIIMDVYGISQEEAQEFLGKKGVGTGGASEFEGI